MTRDVPIGAIVRELQDARARHAFVQTYTDRFENFDEAAGYEVAELVHQANLDEGSTSVGCKIGLTNREKWPLLAAYQPAWAHVYDRTVRYLQGSTGTYRISALKAPRIEPEIVLHFASAPRPASDLRELLATIDWIAHAFEIVISPYPEWKFKAADCVAASVCHYGLLIGEPREPSRCADDLIASLEQFSVDLCCDGVLRERGSGVNVLGSPLKAMNDLLHVLAKQPNGHRIQASDIVTTGTLTSPLPIRVGETWHTALHGLNLPGLKVSFEA